MDPKLSKLDQQQNETSPALSAGSHQAARHEFATVDDLLRFDAAQTAVPPTIGQRLGESVSREPRPKLAWWRRWLGRSQA